MFDWEKCVAAAWLALALCGSSSAQERPAETTARAKRITPVGVLSGEERMTYFMKPNGLQKAADKYGEFLMEAKVYLMGSNPDLAYAVRHTALIVSGTLLSSQARLVEEGCNIETDYVFRPNEILKGNAKGDIAFTVRGGRFTFADGNSAEMRTVDSHFLNVGDRYLLFMTNVGRDGQRGLDTPEESAYRLLDSGAVDPSVIYAGNGHDLAAEVVGQKTITFLAKIRSLVAQQMTHQ